MKDIEKATMSGRGFDSLGQQINKLGLTVNNINFQGFSSLGEQLAKLGLIINPTTKQLEELNEEVIQSQKVFDIVEKAKEILE